MAGITDRSFDQPDETRRPDKTTIDLVRMGEVSVARARFEPGWRWSECIGPLQGTEWCEVHHVGVMVSGRVHVVHRDGSESEAGGGTAYVIEPGHDAWVVGDEAAVAYEFAGAEQLGKG